jgi:hypothetical protein
MKCKTVMEQKLADDARLLRAWRRWHAEQLEETLNGPHGAAVARIIAFLKGMEPQSAPALITLLHEFDWSQMDADVRFVILHETNQAITRLRERSGLPPIDDPLPGQRENAFRLIREHLFPRKAESPPERSGKTQHGDSNERYSKPPSQD